MTPVRALLAVLSLLAAGSRCLALEGSATLRSTAHFKVQRCGGFGDTFRVTLQLHDDGTWAVVSDTGVFSGTYAAIDAAGRKLALTFDAQSEPEFIEGLVRDASEICRRPVSVGPITPKTFALTLNRKRTRVTLKVKVVGVASANGRTATVTWRLQGSGRLIGA